MLPQLTAPESVQTPELRAALWQWEWDEVRNAAKAVHTLPAAAVVRQLFTPLMTVPSPARANEVLRMDGVGRICPERCARCLSTTRGLETAFKGLRRRAYAIAVRSQAAQRRALQECRTLSAQPEVYTDINLTVRQFGQQESIKSVEEGLKNFYKREPLEGANQYQCDRCNKV